MFNTITVIGPDWNQPAPMDLTKIVKLECQSTEVIELALKALSQTGKLTFYTNNNPSYHTDYYFKLKGYGYLKHTCYVNENFIGKFSKKAKEINLNLVWERLWEKVDINTNKELSEAKELAKTSKKCFRLRGFQTRVNVTPEC